MLENYENIIIYGLGLSGLEVLNKLKNKKNIFIWDDSEKKRKELEKEELRLKEIEEIRAQTRANANLKAKLAESEGSRQG